MKKSFYFCTIMVLVLQLLPVAVYADIPSDIDRHWAYGYISDWSERGYVNSYADGTFKPDKPISRGEFVTLVNKVMGLNAPAAINFSDVSQSSWLYNEVAVAVGAGYISGYSDGTMRPDGTLTRQEAAAIVARLLNFNDKPEYSDYFTDRSAIKSYAVGPVGATIQMGIFKGYTDGSFKPDKSLTRAEAVVILKNAEYRRYAAGDATDYQTSGLKTDGRVDTDDNYESYTRLSSQNNTAPDRTSDDLIISRSNYGASKEEDFRYSVFVESINSPKIRNMNVDGDFTIESSVNNTVELNNVNVKGKLFIYGGETVRLVDCEIDEIVFDGNKRTTIQTEGKTKTTNITLYRGATLEEKYLESNRGFRNVTLGEGYLSREIVYLNGEFNKVYILDSYGYINVDSGVVQDLKVEEDAYGSQIHVARDAKIEAFSARAKCTVTGNGKIKSANIRSSGVVMSITPDTITGSYSPEYDNTNSGSEESQDGKYTVYFHVKTQDGSVAQGASVSFNGNTKTTDSNGRVYFVDTKPGTFTYTVDMSKYSSVKGSVTVTDRNVDEDVVISSTSQYYIEITVTSNNKPVKGASVSIDGKDTISTDSNGIARFDAILPGTYSYTVSYGGATKSGSIKISSMNGFEIVDFSSESYTLTVEVTDGALPISGASVAISSASGTVRNGTSGADGTADFAELLPDVYDVEVSATGYHSKNTTVTISTSDRQITVQLNPDI